MSDSPTERENLTAALVRDYDDEQLVIWIHALQDREEELETKIDNLEEERSTLKYTINALILGNKQMANRIKELEELVDNLTTQATLSFDDQTYDSGALTAYANGLRDMAKRGKVRITHEFHRRVIAEPAKEEDADETKPIP